MQMCEGIQVFFHGFIFLFCEPRDEISLAIIFIFFFFLGMLIHISNLIGIRHKPKRAAKYNALAGLRNRKNA